MTEEGVDVRRKFTFFKAAEEMKSATEEAKLATEERAEEVKFSRADIERLASELKEAEAAHEAAVASAEITGAI